MKLNKTDQYSPNYILGTLLVAGFCVVVLCGQSLWVPASRIENLYFRAVVLSVTDAASAFSASTGLDQYVPQLRTGFLSVSGLAGHESWDTRYYNRRSASAEPSETGAVPPSAAVAQGAAAVSALTGLNSAPVANAVTVPGMPSALNYALSSGLLFPARPALMPGSSVSPPSGSAPVAFHAPGKAISSVHSAENPLKVFMFGDSQVFSLGSGLSRLAGKESSVSVDFLAIHSSGFIRGDYYNWSAKLSDTFSQNSYEAAVMMLGMNDYQSFWNNKGQIMKKGTPEWEAAYKEKCRTIIDEVLSSVPRLYWIGMPVVRNGMYNTNLAYINSVQDSLALEYSPDILVRMSIRDIFPGKDKSYTDSIETGNGTTIKVMNGDGSHFTVEGGQLVMQPLFDRFGQDFLFSAAPVAHLPD